MLRSGLLSSDVFPEARATPHSGGSHRLKSSGGGVGFTSGIEASAMDGAGEGGWVATGTAGSGGVDSALARDALPPAEAGVGDPDVAVTADGSSLSAGRTGMRT